MAALNISSNVAVKRGIYQDLNGTFNFDALRKTNSRENFIKRIIPDISARSKSFFIQGSEYLRTGTSGAVELNNQQQLFSMSRVVEGLAPSLQIPEVSFTAWVKMSADFHGGYVLRKPLRGVGQGSDLSCWGWYLSPSGPELHFGAQDFFPASASDSNARQELVRLGNATIPTSTDLFLTMIISGSEVSFYRDQELLGASPLPRKLTDCTHTTETLLIGDGGLQLGQVRFHPRALGRRQIQEIFEAGTTLADLATGSQPALSDESDLDIASRSLQSSVSVVGQAVLDRKPSVELNNLLLEVDSALIEQDQRIAKSRAPPAPQGRLPVNTTELEDPISGHRYYALLPSPVILSKPMADETPRYFDPATLPNFIGRGVTFTTWYRHCDKGDGPTCGLFLLYKHDAGMRSASVCWSFWIEDNGVYFDNPHANPSYIFPFNFLERKYRWDHRTWRHLALSLNETDDHIYLFVDGEMALRVAWGSPVTGADCTEVAGLAEGDRPGNLLALGHQFPGYTYGQPSEVHDLRMYVGVPPSAEHLRALAGVSTPPPISEDLRCYAADSPSMRDSAWNDAFGHSCEWLYGQREIHPGLCLLPSAIEQCPISCGSKQECFSNLKPAGAFWVWDRIQRVGEQSAKGSLCLDSGLDPARLVEDCHRWEAQGGLVQDWLGKQEWIEGMTSTETRRLNVTDCAELEAAIDPQCSFQADAVKAFTEVVEAGGGDYTVAFWVRPVGSKSLVSDRFFPQAHFMASISPPQHNLMIGKTVMNLNGESRVYTSCFSGNGRSFEYTELRPAATDGWTFVAFTRLNQSTPTENRLTTNLFQNVMVGEFRQCFYDPEHMFRSIEFNYPMLVSPIMMIPEVMPASRLQETYYKLASDLQVRLGPKKDITAKGSNASSAETARRSPGATRKSIVHENDESYARLAVEKQDYLPRLALVVSPILFQTRFQPSGTCPTHFGGEWIQHQHEKLVESACAAPFQCQAELLDQPELTMACHDKMKVSQTYFGLEPTKFKGMAGYAELLYSVADYAKLFREGQLKSTASFLDSSTSNVNLLLVFFAPQYGMTTVLSVIADFSGPQPIDVTVNLEHFEIVDGARVVALVATLSGLLVVVLAMAVYIRRDAMKLWAEFSERRIRRRLGKELETMRQDRASFPKRVILLCVDLASLVMVLVVGTRMGLMGLQSDGEAREIVGGLGEIPWESADVSIRDKKDAFFDNVERLLRLVRSEAEAEALLYVVLLMSIFRIMQSTSLHPRLALLEGTLSRAADDLWHTLVLIGLILSCFAAIGSWRFGSERPQFATFGAAIQTELRMTIEGTFFEGWDESIELQVFAVLYLITVNILVLNFILAVVVNSYMDSRASNRERPWVQEFTTDILCAASAVVCGKLSGWPNSRRLGELLSHQKAKLAIGYRDLLKTNLFSSPDAVCSFLRYYREYSFLVPDSITRYGRMPSRNEDRLATDIERRVARLLGSEPVSLKEEAMMAANSGPRRTSSSVRITSGSSFRRRSFVATSSSTCGLVGRRSQSLARTVSDDDEDHFSLVKTSSGDSLDFERNSKDLQKPSATMPTLFKESMATSQTIKGPLTTHTTDRGPVPTLVSKPADEELGGAVRPVSASAMPPNPDAIKSGQDLLPSESIQGRLLFTTGARDPALAAPAPAALFCAAPCNLCQTEATGRSVAGGGSTWGGPRMEAVVPLLRPRLVGGRLTNRFTPEDSPRPAVYTAPSTGFEVGAYSVAATPRRLRWAPGADEGQSGVGGGGVGTVAARLCFDSPRGLEDAPGTDMAEPPSLGLRSAGLCSGIAEVRGGA